MMAAVALSSLIGTWHCTRNDDTKGRVLYTFHADRTGTLTSYIPGTRWRITRHFTFKLTREGLIEQYNDPKSHPLERHDIRLTGRHLVDDNHVYWYEGQWTGLPTDSMLDCRR